MTAYHTAPDLIEFRCQVDGGKTIRADLRLTEPLEPDEFDAVDYELAFMRGIRPEKALREFVERKLNG